MSTLTLPHAAYRPNPHIGDPRHADFLRVALLLMLFVNVALGAVVLLPESVNPDGSAEIWHGNASGDAMK